MSIRLQLILVLTGFCLTLNAAPALADVTACNKTANDVAVAIGIETATSTTSYGWWVLSPNICEKLIEIDDGQAQIYAYAEHHVVAGGWSGDTTFCVATGQFEISGRDKCLSRGYKPVGFFKIDIKPSQDVRYDFIDSED
ncbi:MAG: DUF1036 domain-containing protein [Alphaproteobacteria bacterium]|nr:MAG: DUF1036 domain-containing protein [Alphaproteobacteria bacterium]